MSEGNSKKGRQKLVEDVKEVRIRQGDTKKTMNISANLEKWLRRKLVECLWAHSLVAWGHPMNWSKYCVSQVSNQ